MTKKKVSKKRFVKTTPSNFSPDYITLNGHTYERLEDHTVNVELDIEDDVLDQLNVLVKSGKYVSVGDAVRHILRSMIDSIDHDTVTKP
jgi:hypothetical protein